MPDLNAPYVKENDIEGVIDALQWKSPNHLYNVMKLKLKLEQFHSWFPPCPDSGSLKELMQWLDDERSRNHIAVKKEGLHSLTEWHFDDNGHFSHKDGKFFKIVGLEVSSPCREVKTWSQPIMKNEGTGIIGLLLKRVNGTTFFLMQAKADAGNRNLVQIGPTVQFNPANYIDNERLKKPFLFEAFLDTTEFIPVMESMQAEEGGRFYREDHVHKILMLPDGMELAVPSRYRWFSHANIRFFLHIGDVVNSSARSILACLA